MNRKRIISLMLSLALILLSVPAMAVTGDLAISADGKVTKVDPFSVGYEGEELAKELIFGKLFTTDRSGSIVMNGAEGEKSTYNGTSYTYYGPASLTVAENGNGQSVYTITLRNDISFSDGTFATIDDVIFAMYVTLDPSYTGGLAFADLPIEGVNEYRYGINGADESLYSSEAVYIRECGYDTSYAEASLYWKDAFDAGGADYANALAAAYSRAYPDVAPHLGDDTVSAAMYIWGFATADKNADKLTCTLLGKTWKISEGEYPTAADFWQCLKKTFMTSATDMDGLDKMMELCPMETGLFDYVDKAYTKLRSTTGEAASTISGIVKTGENSVSVTLTEASSEFEAAIATLPLVPAAWYGDGSGVDTENAHFGFTKGDLSCVSDKKTSPVGAGYYVLDSFTGNGVLLNASGTCWLGKPLTRSIEIVTRGSESAAVAVYSGAYDIVTIDLTKDEAASIRTLNADTSALTGETITSLIMPGTIAGYLSAGTTDAVTSGVAQALAILLKEGFSGDSDLYTLCAQDSSDISSVLEPQTDERVYTLAISGGEDNPVYAAAQATVQKLSEYGITLSIADVGTDELMSGNYDLVFAAADGVADDPETGTYVIYYHNQATLFSGKRINMSTLPADMTESYTWTNGVKDIAVYN